MNAPDRRRGDIEREDIEAALEVRRELGPAYEREVVDSFVDRIERAVADRVDAQLAHQRAVEQQRAGDKQRQLALGIVSLVVSIPITIPLAVTDHLPAVLVSWLGIAAVNAAHAATVNRPSRRHDPGRTG